MATSTFNFARQVIIWLKNVDPNINCLEDDILPLCVGPMKKVLQFSMSNFRSKDDISKSVERREKAIELLKSREKKRINKEKRGRKRKRREKRRKRGKRKKERGKDGGEKKRRKRKWRRKKKKEREGRRKVE